MLPLGAVPKKSSDTWRLILHLSSPEGSSIKDGIPPDDFRLHYISVGTTIKHILALGHSCSLAKFDIKSAFRLIPVHPDDWELLGMHWNNSLDTVLPFDLHSAPFLFNQIANGLEWILKSHGIPVLLHYLNDFFIIAQTHHLCGAYLELATTLCSRLGAPLADDKTEGLATLLTFLGIELNTTTMEARLPPQKLSRLVAMISDWLSRHSASKRELQSLLGHLYAASKVVVPGRTFVRRIVDQLKALPNPNATLVLSNDFFADLRGGNLIWRAGMERASFSSQTLHQRKISSSPPMCLVPLASALTSMASGSMVAGPKTSRGRL